MKVRLYVLVMLISVACLLPLGADRVSAQRRKAIADPVENRKVIAPDPDLQPIQDNILVVRGMKFPKLPASKAAGKSSAQGCCTIGDTRNITVLPFNYNKPPVFPKGTVTHQRDDPYSPPSTCWVISTYNLNIKSANNASYSLTAVPGNYSFVTSGQYQQTLEDVKNTVINMNILDKFKVDLISNLKTFTDNYAMYASNLGASHPSLILHTTLTSAGLTKGNSWVMGEVNSNETCCPLEIQDPAALKVALTNWVNNTVNSLPNKGRPLTRNLDGFTRGHATQKLKAVVDVEPSPSPTPSQTPPPSPR